MIVSASAGAGKTHTLAMRLIQLLLSPAVPRNDLKNILAVTFTNAAAAEMKQRVLKLLKEIALDPLASAASEAGTLVSLDAAALSRRAGEMVGTILDRYGDFQVRTIDSFMTRVFKATALEFGFQPEFEIVMDQKPLIAYAFDVYARGAAADETRMAELRQVVRLLTDQVESGRTFPWDPYARMISRVTEILRTLASKTASLSSKDRSWELPGELEKLRSAGRGLQEAVSATTLTMNSRLADDLAAAAGEEWRVLLGRKEKGAVVNTPKTAAGRAELAGREHEFLELLGRFNSSRQRLAVLDAALFYRPFTIALRTVSSAIEEAKRRKGAIAIDDVNRMLVEFLASGTVPQVMIVLGERIAHYLIDEFQDTSPVQWAALRVLVENALAEGGSLFAVGDTKQSIYGFRGADWRIMRNLYDGRETIIGSPVIASSLDRNYRSGEAIVRFLREVFQNRVAATSYARYAPLSGLHDYIQEPADTRRGAGYVEVLHLPNTPERPEAAALTGLIDDALHRGFRRGDIAVLTPSNQAVLEISTWLNGARISFLSHSSLDIRTRKTTAELLALLSFLESPVDELAFATFILGDLFGAFCSAEFPGLDSAVMRGLILERWQRTGPAGRHPLYGRFREQFPAVWDRCFESLFSAVGYLPLYDVVCEVFKTFDLLRLAEDEQSGLIRFLEVVKEFEALGNNSLKEFLVYTDDESDKEMWSIERQQNPEAVTVMTVHKAKGLQFPVVITLLYDAEKRPSPMVFHEEPEGLELWHITKGGSGNAPELEAEYTRELELCRADELNRLYVALTRAEEELYVVCVDDGKGGFPSMLFPGQEGGNARPAPGRRTTDAATGAIRPVSHTLRTPARPGDARRIGYLETQRGDYYHTALARLEFLEGDTAAAVESVLSSSAPSEIESRELIRERLLSFLSLEEIRLLFIPREGRTVRTEQEFLSRSGALYRMDRLVIDPSEVTVIDFKTGGEGGEEVYREQIRNYIAILRDIFPGCPVRGAIAYIDGGRLSFINPEPPVRS